MKIIHIVGPLYLWALDLQTQPILNQNSTEKIFRKFQNAKLDFSECQQLFITFIFIYNYLLRYDKWSREDLNYAEDIHGLYANTVPFYLRDLSTYGFGYPWGSWDQSPRILRNDCSAFNLLNFDIVIFCPILFLVKIIFFFIAFLGGG